MEQDRKFIQNKKCENFPCHNDDNQNCLFCFCPLYFIDCKGDARYEDGVKICDNCMVPHGEDSYLKINSVIHHLQDHAKKFGGMEPNLTPMTLEEAIAHARNLAASNNASGEAHKLLFKWLSEYKALKATAMSEEDKTILVESIYTIVMSEQIKSEPSLRIMARTLETLVSKLFPTIFKQLTMKGLTKH